MIPSILSLGLGLATKDPNGTWLEAYYPAPLSSPSPALLAALDAVWQRPQANQFVALEAEPLKKLLAQLESLPEAAQWVKLARLWEAGQKPVLLTASFHDQAPVGVPDIFLNLQLLSHRLVKPHQINLTGIFGKLLNLAWTNQGPIPLDQLDEARSLARLKGETLVVRLVDKFPPMADYVVPKGVRIADASRVRLGAYLGEGTTIMHEGFVNFNAGTLGESMVEGRISAGVIVGKGSDLGGGCSTMGTLSGGNNAVISIGEKCLIGANAGVGIPLGDRCTIEAGLYLTAGSKVLLLDDKGQTAKTVKAAQLSGQSDLLFRRNSLNGALECLTNKSAIALNQELHKNN